MAEAQVDLAKRLAEGDRRPETVALLRNLKAALPELEKLLGDVGDHWAYEDKVYRFYHQSFKVFHLQDHTLRIVEALKALTPKPDVERKRRRFWYYYEKDAYPIKPPPLHPWFMRIVEGGTGKVFSTADNTRWQETTRPILEAFMHARYFLEMAVKYGREFRRLKYPPCMMPSGWAALLYLYDLR